MLPRVATSFCRVPIWFDIVAEKLGSSPNAAANSFKVFNAVGAESIRSAIASSTIVCNSASTNTCVHTEPVHILRSLVVELKYSEPTCKVSPSLSNVGSEVLEPK